MKRYYDKLTHTETHIESATTIPSNDARVVDFFSPLPSGKRLVFVNDLPIIEDIPTPTPQEEQARLDAESDAQIKAELDELDRQSIRSIREYIAAQPDAPQILKDKEAQANIKRGQLKNV